MKKKMTSQEIEETIEKSFSHYDEDAKERIRKFLSSSTKEITYDTTQEQNEMIAKAIDNCPCCKSRSRFAQDYLNINSQMLYRKLKGLRKFTNNEIKIIENHLNICFNSCGGE